MDIGIVSQNTSERKSFFDRLRGDDAVGETVTFSFNFSINCKMDTLDNIALELKEKAMLELAKELSIFMSKADTHIKDSDYRKNRGYHIKDIVDRTYMTVVGDVSFSRRYYEGPDGERVYLLDEFMGISPRERVSKNASATLVNNSGAMSYAKAVGQTGLQVSRQTVCNRVHSTEDVVVKVPEEKRVVDDLHIFIDEGHTKVHGDKRKVSVIVPLIVISEGIDASDPNRHVLKNPIFLGFYRQNTETMFDQVYGVAARRYDISRVRNIYVHSDGGNWIKGIKDVFPDYIPVMDEFHIMQHFREMRSYFAEEDIGVLMRLVKQGMKKEFVKHFSDKFAEITDLNKKQNARSTFTYFKRNWVAITNRYKLDVCGSCTEAEVSHVLSERISRTPCAWSYVGLDKITMIRILQANGGMIKGENINVTRDKEGEEKSLNTKRKEGYKDHMEYLEEERKRFVERLKEIYMEENPKYYIDPSSPIQKLLRALTS